MLKLLKVFANGERYQTIATVVICLALVWFFSCEPQTQSVSDPGRKVNRSQLQAELNFTIATYESRFKELDQWDRLIELAFQQGQLLAAGGVFNPVGLLASVGAIFGVGATIDNVRKRKEIKILKNT